LVGPIKVNLEIISCEVSSIHKLKNGQNFQVKGNGDGGGRYDLLSPAWLGLARAIRATSILLTCLAKKATAICQPAATSFLRVPCSAAYLSPPAPPPPLELRHARNMHIATTINLGRVFPKHLTFLGGHIPKSQHFAPKISGSRKPNFLVLAFDLCSLFQWLTNSSHFLISDGVSI
jgi:hypothetical protein